MTTTKKPEGVDLLKELTAANETIAAKDKQISGLESEIEKLEKALEEEMEVAEEVVETVSMEPGSDYPMCLYKGGDGDMIVVANKKEASTAKKDGFKAYSPKEGE